MSAEPDLKYVASSVAVNGRASASLIPILNDLQAHFRWLPPAALQQVAALTGLPAAQVAGVASFYDRFRHAPAGEHLISICHGTACHVKGSPRVDQALRQALGLKPGEDTSGDQRFTLQKVACLGCCTLAPVVQIKLQTYGHVQSAGVPQLLKDFCAATQTEIIPAITAPRAGARIELRLGAGSCCAANGSTEVRATLEAAAARRGLPLLIKPVGCSGICHRTPLIEIRCENAAPIIYANVGPAQVETILDRHVPQHFLAALVRRAGSAIDRLLGDERHRDLDRRRFDEQALDTAPFLKPQVRLATAESGEHDPTDLDEYEAHGGFAAYRKALAGTPDNLLGTITDAGLRGRGGAGFPTGRKWCLARHAAGEAKYVICNGDEGDPGAFMDRMILESWPYRVIEGLAIAAYAVGAEEGLLYIRAEYPLAVARIREALRHCEKRGVFSEHPSRTGRRLHLRVVEGAGAFICGEETALIASVAGLRGTPRLRPPYPVESGLDGRPTCVNNVETLALVPWIVRHGAEAFARLGTAGSRGTKVFSLAGKICRGGLIEVPMGLSLRTIIEDIGGGVGAGRTFKAVQIGGPSGGCIPAALCDVPVDFEALTRLGAIMGSGGLVVLDDRDCMVDMARYFLRFTQDQSCGKCTFCRIGTRQMLDILERLCSGTAQAADLDRLDHLARQVKASSLCGLGQTAPNPVLTTLKYFRSEYVAHLAGHCPAGRCQKLIRYEVTDHCTGCTKCVQVCPVEAIPFTPYQRHVIDVEKCTRCDACRTACPEGAINVF